jgi:hypothetical protein
MAMRQFITALLDLYEIATVARLVFVSMNRKTVDSGHRTYFLRI